MTVMSRERPLRALYLLPAEGFGGAERQAVEHIRRLPELGIDVTPLVGPGHAVLAALERAGVQRYVFIEDFPGTGRNRPAWAGTIGDWLEWFKAARRCKRAVLRAARSAPFDVVFATRAIAWPLAGIICEELGIPYVIRAGGRPANPLTRLPLLFLRTLPPPSLFVANCEAVRAPLAKWFACPSRVLQNGVDTLQYAPRSLLESRMRMQLPSDRPIVGLSARPAPEKGIEFFAHVADGVSKRIPNALFLIAGEHVTRRHYERMVRDLGLADRISFLGHLGEMQPFYASCDVIALTSPRVSIEGSPNALLEAMAMQRPIVATSVGGVPELVRDGIEGFLDEPNRPEDFVEHVVRLLQHPALRSQMGWQGRRRVETYFRAQSVAQELAGILRACARRSVDVRQPVPALGAVRIPI